MTEDNIKESFARTNSITFFSGAALDYAMIDAQQITLRFFDTRLQVHLDVVRYIRSRITWI